MRRQDLSVSEKKMKSLIWEAQKLLAGRYYGPISETAKVHMQLCDVSEGTVEPLVDQRLYCDMRYHSQNKPGGKVRACVFALGSCTRNDDNKLRKDVPELAIICTVESATLEEINGRLDRIVEGSDDLFAFLESRRSGDLGMATDVSFMVWDLKRGELRPTDEADFSAKYHDLLEQVGIQV